MRSNDEFSIFLANPRTVQWTYWIAYVQLAILVVGEIIFRLFHADVWVLFLLFGLSLLGIQIWLLYLVLEAGSFDHLNQYLNKKFSPVGWAEMFPDRDPDAEKIGGMHIVYAVGGCFLSLFGTLLIFMVDQLIRVIFHL